ncbi:MAG: sigma-54 dependent transcriptional regulator [Geobacteraceae bacterium]|nr:sigma-54 dependent transcriptional regulator [Geobacteraceae bacterium]
MKALVIDDESSIRLALTHFLRGRGYETLEAATAGEGLALARATLPDIVFLDQRLPDMDGDTILPSLIAPEIGAIVVMMTAYAELDKAVQAMKKGAEYYFSKPVDLDNVAVILERLAEKVKLKSEVEHYRKIVDSAGDGELLTGESPRIIRVQRLISLLAQNRATPVLILGESGSGKGLVAKAIHALSAAKGPMVEINCASLSENLLESELFGHEKGAFTDARETKKGLFEIADEGTIFFDELAEMPLSVQAKLLKVLDSRTFRRLGGVSDLKSSARIMAATNNDIARQVRKGLFREDLYYRINVLPITVPPLRERGKDIIILASQFARRLGEGMGKGKVTVSAEAMGHLLNYTWPGNVRELRNIVERALILLQGEEIRPEHLPGEIRHNEAVPFTPSGSLELRPLSKVTDEYMAQVLQITGQNHSRAAAVLGISRSTLLAWLKKKKADVSKSDMS